MILPNAWDIFVCGAALNAAQWLTTLLVIARFRREFSVAKPAFSPPVTLIMAAKGDSPDFAGNIAAFLDQDYAGQVDYLLATCSRKDAAHQRLDAAFSARPGLSYALVASEQLPSASSGKALDLVHALKAAPPKGEVLVFADADVRVHRSWLSELVAPLRDPGVTASTSILLAVPREAGFWSFLRLVWLGVTVGFISFMDTVCGQSLAMRRKDFYELDVPACWETALLEDLSLTSLLRRRKKTVRFVARAMPVTGGDCGRREFFDVVNRWIKCWRLFGPGVWLMGWSFLMVKAGITVWCLANARLRLLALFWAVDMANVAALFSAYRRYLPERFAGLPALYRPLPLWAALASPVVTVVYLVNYLASLLDDDVRWGSYVYHVGEGERLTVARKA